MWAGYDHDLGAGRVGLDQTGLERLQVAGDAERHDLAIGMMQIQGFRRQLLRDDDIELIQFLMTAHPPSAVSPTCFLR